MGSRGSAVESPDRQFTVKKIQLQISELKTWKKKVVASDARLLSCSEKRPDFRVLAAMRLLGVARERTGYNGRARGSTRS